MGGEPTLEAIAAIAAGEAVGPDDLARLVDALGASRKIVQRRAAEVLARLAAHDEAVRELLRDASGQGPLRRRWGATYALSLGGTLAAACLPVLVEVMGDADGDLRWAAADLAVGMGATPEVVETLARLARDGNAAQRKMALYCLRDLPAEDTRLLGGVEAACVDADPGVRLAAISALARLAGDRPSAAAAVTARLRDDEPGVRRAAAATLGRLRGVGPATVAALRAAAVDADEPLRRAATQALARLGHGPG